MDYLTLGKTGLCASVVGLGAGGHSLLGTATGKSEKEAIALVQRALDRGINLIDTAEAYGTERIIGAAVRGRRREQVLISTKKQVTEQGKRRTPKEMEFGIEQCLQRLDTDVIDLFHLHGLALEDYDYAVSDILPALQKMRRQGKIRFIGITEAFPPDPGHRTLSRALQDDHWDAVMVGFNILNQSARKRVLPLAIEKNIGVLLMYGVRNAFSRPERLREILRELHEKELIDDQFDDSDPLGFLIRDGGAQSLVDGAYRFCRHEPGVHVVLSGTGNVEHLEANIRSLHRPPLADPVRYRLQALFSKVDSFCGN